MKTFVYHDIDDCKGRQRIEDRQPTVQTLGEEPRHEVQRVALRPNMDSAHWNHARDYSMNDTFVMHSMVFETVRFSTMKWIENRHDNDNSYGYYARVDSFCQVPDGARLEGAMKYEQGTDIYSYLNTIPLHRTHTSRSDEKIRDMEKQLAILSTRPIMSEEQLRRMRADWLDTRDCEASIPQRLKEYDYFENDNDFKME